VNPKLIPLARCVARCVHAAFIFVVGLKNGMVHMLISNQGRFSSTTFDQLKLAFVYFTIKKSAEGNELTCTGILK